MKRAESELAPVQRFRLLVIGGPKRITFRHIGIATLSGLFVAASVAVCQTATPENSQRNTLSYYDPGMLKTMHAYGPLFSDDIPRASTESAAPNDFVEKI